MVAEGVVSIAWSSGDIVRLRALVASNRVPIGSWRLFRVIEGEIGGIGGVLRSKRGVLVVRKWMEEGDGERKRGFAIPQSLRER